jgi:hypothetical protein
MEVWERDLIPMIRDIWYHLTSSRATAADLFCRTGVAGLVATQCFCGQNCCLGQKYTRGLWAVLVGPKIGLHAPRYSEMGIFFIFFLISYNYTIVSELIKTIRQTLWLTTVHANRSGLQRLERPTALGHGGRPTAAREAYRL